MLPTKDLNELRKDQQFDVELHGQKLHFRTTWGLFNPTSIDDGTYLLAKNLAAAPNAVCLDLGCGYGALGITLAKLCPTGTIHMVDKDFVAVEYAKKNAAANGAHNTKTYLSNGFDQVPTGTQFDLIVSNLPAKVGKELLYIMFNDAKDRLKPGGQFMVVTIAGLKDYMKRQLTEVFGNFKKIDHTRTYMVSLAIKD